MYDIEAKKDHSHLPSIHATTVLMIVQKHRRALNRFEQRTLNFEDNDLLQLFSVKIYNCWRHFRCKIGQDMVYLTCLRFFQIWPQATTIYNLDAQGHQTFGKPVPTRVELK